MPRSAILKPVRRKKRAAEGLHAWCVNVPVELSPTGRRQELFFATQADARIECEKLKVRRDNFGLSLSNMTAAKVAAASEAYKILDPLGIDLLDAVRGYAVSHKTRTASIPFLELFNLYLEAKQDRNPEYLRELRITLDRWPELHSKLAYDITPQELGAILDQLSPGARNPVMRYWRAVFNFGVKRGYLAENPIARLDFASRPRRGVETISVNQVSRMLAHALAEDLKLLPYLIFGFFAGVRPEDESMGLEWRDFDPVDGVLTMRSEITKTARRRFIKLEKNALAWLHAYRERGGTFTEKVVPYAARLLRTRRLINRAAAGVTRWPNSAMRHTFCSHHLAKFEDVNRLTLMIGHTSPTMLWNHYYKAVPKAEADKFWAIMPPASAGNIVPFEKAS
jgi:integrase